MPKTLRRWLPLLGLGLLLAPRLPARTLDEARALHAQGRLREAVAAYRAAAAAAGRADLATTAAAHDSACAVLDETGDLQAALDECTVALRIRRGLGDARGTARTLSHAGLVLFHLGEPSEAELRFRDALEIYRIAGDAQGQVASLSHLGRVASSQGRYHRALVYYSGAEALAEGQGDEPWAADQVQAARLHQGLVLEKMGAWQEALAVYRAALAEAGRLAPRLRAALQVSAGAAHRNLGDPDSALAAYDEAIRLYDGEGDRAGLSRAWLGVGVVRHLGLDQPQAAAAAYRKALAFGERGGEAEILYYLGRLLLERGRLDEAGRAFQGSLRAAAESGSPEGRWSALDGLGRVAAARGDIPRAVAFLQQATTEIGRARITLRRSAPGFHLFGDKRPVFTAAVGLLAAAGREEEALETVQQAKVRELLDSVGGAGRVEVLAADRLRKEIGGGLLLEYFLGDRDLLLWIVRRDGVEMANLGPHAPILADAAAVHQALSRGEAPDRGLLARLSRILLGPVRTLDTDELRIAPDGALRYLPFELLDAPGAASTPLVELAATSYLPSGSALGWPRQLDSFEASFKLVGYAVPERPAGSGPAATAAEHELQPLPEPAGEMQALARRLPGQHSLALGAEATEPGFRRSVSDGAHVVHLATHTVIDERPGRGAAVLLAPGGDDDGLLYPEEIAALPYRAHLSVLARGRTVLPPGSPEADAFAALTGSFLAAGSPAVVAPLWEMEDAPAAAFQEALYTELGRGRRPAEALRRARLRLRDDPRWSRPEHWAGYVLVGDSPRVAGGHRRRWALGVLALAVLALAPWLIDAHRARRGTVLEASAT